MKRFLVALVVVPGLVVSPSPFSQTALGSPQVAGPGALAPGATIPGITPPRDKGTRGPQTGTSRIKGRVVSQAGVPLQRAQVAITSMEGLSLRRVTTDAEGRYEFQELPAGRFNVTAAKAGFVSLEYGQRRPYEAGKPVTIADHQTVERIDFALPRGSVIVVRVTDEFGEPLVGAQVQVQRFHYGPDGRRRLRAVSGGVNNGTDDRGELRAYGLMPGEYVLLANIRNLAGSGTAKDTYEGFATTYYPRTTSSAEALPISVGIGEEHFAQISMVPSRMGRVTGTVVDSEGRPATGARLTVFKVSGSPSSYSAGVVADGSFTVSGLTPGEHTIRVTQSRTGSPAESASVPVVLNGADITGLRIMMEAGATITGRVVFEGTSPRAGVPTMLRVSAQQADPQRGFVMLGTTDPLANGAIADDGTFRLGGVTGRVFLSMAAPPGWAIKSVSQAGDDITNVPIDLAGKATISDVKIVLTDKLTYVSGQVADARGRPLTDYVVIIQPAEQKEPIIASRSIRVVRPDTSGRFQTQGMGPGRYVATAIESIAEDRQFEPGFQKQLRRDAIDFVVREGESVTVNLRLTPDL